MMSDILVMEETVLTGNIMREQMWKLPERLDDSTGNVILRWTGLRQELSREQMRRSWHRGTLWWK